MMVYHDGGVPMSGCWPTIRQELLLRASLLKGEHALVAWREWSAHADINTIDAGSYRLLPLLYRNLCEHGIDHPALPKLKGVYRQVWYKNQMLLHGTAEVLRLLHNAGIPTMVLKGTAAMALYYRDYGLRGMEDVDILIPVDKALEVLRLLPASGLIEHFPLPKTLPSRFFEVVHSQAYSDALSHQFDVHWHVFPECGAPDTDDNLWQAAVPLVLNGVETRALNPADQLLHICTHGVRWNALPPLRWIADASVLLSTAPPDWARLVEQAQNRQLVLPMRKSLLYLRSLLKAPIPEHVLEILYSTPVSARECNEYNLRLRPAHKPVAALSALWYKHLRVMLGESPFRVLASFPQTVRLACRLDSTIQLPVHALRVSGRTILSLFS